MNYTKNNHQIEIAGQGLQIEIEGGVVVFGKDTRKGKQESLGTTFSFVALLGSVVFLFG
jgi:hypothetical protein